MNIQQALQSLPGQEAELLLGHALRKPKEFLYTHPNYQIPKNKYQEFTKLVKKREKGEPIAYILGYKDFFGLRFKVTKDVLVPRPETEWIVEEALKEISSNKNQVSKILDVGTGSGCLSISIAKNLNKIKIKHNITASDISSKALKVAKANTKTHKVKIDFLKSDLFSKVGERKFDLIIANLPYVPLKDYKKLLKGLKFEPRLALTDGTNNFIIYKKFFEQVGKHLSETGKIFLETDPASKTYLSAYTKKYLPKYKIKFFKDLNKLTRYAEIKL